MSVETPFTGWPKTQPIYDRDGNPSGCRVTAGYLSPTAAKMADLCGIFFGFFVLYETFMAACYLDTWTQMGIAMGAAVVFALLCHQLFRIFARTVSVIEFTNDAIKVARLWGWRVFDRGFPCQFDLQEDERAEDEAEAQARRHTRAQMRGERSVPEVWKYYRQSYFVVMRHGRRRIDIACVYGRRRAEQLLARLQDIESGWQTTARDGEDYDYAGPRPGVD